jgi:dolichol-phosphate mannosyltransferase
MNIYLLLPAYNEERALAELLPKALAVEPKLKITVLNDGSTDRTAQLVQRFPEVKLLRHDANQGLGAALRSLIKEALAKAHTEDLLVTMDADDTMDPQLIPVMLKEVEAGADIVIASRFAGGSELGVPTLRKLFARAARLVIAGLFSLRGVQDYTCGFRMYRASLLHELAQAKPNLFDATGFASGVELLLNLLSLQPRVAEVPLHLRYDRKAGRSKMRLAATLCQYLWVLLRLRFRDGLTASKLSLKDEAKSR